MKVASRIVAIAAVLAVASAANATTHVWFTASAPTGQAGITQAGGNGSPAMLTCNTTAANATCGWTITMAFANDAADELMASWAVDLDLRAPKAGGTVAASAFAYVANNFTSHAPANPTLNGSSTSLVKFADGLDLSGGGSSGGNLASFVLTVSKQAAGDVGVSNIYMTTGGVEWAGNFGDYPDISAAGNPVNVGGGAAGNDLGNVIKITNAPEPATLSLLGLGALALIRRRR